MRLRVLAAALLSRGGPWLFALARPRAATRRVGAPRSRRTGLDHRSAWGRHKEPRPPLLAIRGGELPSLINNIDMAATSLFACTATITAGKHGMDLFGALVVASVTALGGGTLREILLRTPRPVFWLARPVYYKIVAVTSVLTFFGWPRLERETGLRDSSKVLCLLDALGLGAFAIIGADAGRLANLDPICWVLFGTVSSCFGGVFRDLLCGSKPRVLFPDRTLYATPPLTGALVYTALMMSRVQAASPPSWVCATAYFATVFVRVAAFTYNRCRLPHWRKREAVVPDDERRDDDSGGPYYQNLASQAPALDLGFDVTEADAWWHQPPRTTWQMSRGGEKRKWWRLFN